MKIGLTVVVVAFAATLVQAKEPEFHLTICTDADALESFHVFVWSRAIVSRIYSGIGVGISWHRGLDGCPPEAIFISVTDRTPPTLLPRALAYALPYKSAFIRVFYDRIEQSGPEPLHGSLFAHVLAHEIAHVLERSDRHSDRGLMKPHWDSKDFAQMTFKPLQFTQLDIDLIYEGLQARSGNRPRSKQVAGQQEPD
jgi:hypothetical protein